MRDAQVLTQNVYSVTLVNASQSVLREGPPVIMAANGTIIQGGDDASFAAEIAAWNPGMVPISYSPQQTPIEASATPLFRNANHPNFDFYLVDLSARILALPQILARLLVSLT